jgi:Family of unknown function (DUF6165)
MSEIKIPVSNGELLDKISILKIKYEHAPKNKNIHEELIELTEIAFKNFLHDDDYIKKLYDINIKLWNVEDKLREFEKKNKFDEEFIELARSVYKLNDNRAKIKKEINKKTNSKYKEVKIYS